MYPEISPNIVDIYSILAVIFILYFYLAQSSNTIYRPPPTPPFEFVPLFIFFIYDKNWQSYDFLKIEKTPIFFPVRDKTRPG